MPHVQIVGARPVAELAELLARVTEANPPLVLKVQESYLSCDARRLLLEVLVVEGYLRQSFFLLAHEEDEGILIRCHPATPVQKTDGVKKLIVFVGRKCAELSPGARIGHTNLEAFL